MTTEAPPQPDQMVELVLHDPQENDSIWTFYCDDPEQFPSRLDGVRRHLIATSDEAGGYQWSEIMRILSYGPLAGETLTKDQVGAIFAAHGLRLADDLPMRTVYTMDYFTALDEDLDEVLE